ncbi:MAG TPA: hypothetical protein VM864_03505, partial [Pyrinomonadaceae bacterium]|nr:hypothetical protein [Pyrinomonadaceae bacterium]
GDPADAAPPPSAARLVEVMRAVADEAPKWKDAAAAASVQAQVADIIWEADATAARAVLARAWEAARRAPAAAPPAERSRFRNSTPTTDAQREVIITARRRAPELAERWLAQMSEDADAARDDAAPRGVFDDRTPRSSVLLEMAAAAVAENPQAAVDLAGASLQDGISFSFQDVLVKLQEKEPALAQTLFTRALQRLRAAGFSDPNELLILSAFLYTPGQTRAANTSENRNSFQLAMNPNAPKLTPLGVSNPALAREFLQLATSLLVNAPLPTATANPAETARAEISVIDAILFYASRSLPDAAPSLEAKVAQIAQDAKFTPRPPAERRDLPPRGSGESNEDYAKRISAAHLDELEESARKETDSLRRDVRFAEAALATGEEDYERGFRLASSISDGELRSNVTNWLAYRSALHFARAGESERSYELSRKNGDPAQRAAVLVAGSQGLLKAKNSARAREWLEEARGLIRKSEPDAYWVRIAFGVASAYAQFDEAMGLESLADAVKLLNKSPDSAGATDERAPFFRRFGGFRQTGIDFTYGTSGFGLRAAARAFKPGRFENVLEILDAVSEREARGAAVVALGRQHFRPAPGAGTRPAKPAAK